MNAGVRMVMTAADANKGVSLPSGPARQVASALLNMDKAAREFRGIAVQLDNLLAAYVEQYGEELMNSLLEVEEGVVDAEVIDEGGQDNEGVGVDAPLEGEEEE